MKRILLTLLLIAYCNISFSDIREYDISLVIFEDKTSRYLHSEKWPTLISTDESNQEQENIIESQPTVIFGEFEDIALMEPTESEQEPEYPENNDVINISDNETSSLAKQVETLKKSKRYKILVNKSWRQTGLDQNDTINIVIDSTKKQIKPSYQELAQTDILSLQLEEVDKSIITGNIKITLGRYLHFYSDLIYQKPTTGLSPLHNLKSETKDYLIKTHRRMRSKEIHYIDHPLVGMLILATPVIHIDDRKFTYQ